MTKPDIQEVPYAFQELYKKYYHSVFRQIRYIVGDTDLAEDITQESFLKLYHSPPLDMAGVKNWLVKVAINLSYNSKRSDKRREKRENIFYQLEEKRFDECEEKVITNLEIQTTRKAIAKLSVRERALLILRYSGYSYREISEILSINQSSVGTSIARAQSRFKQVYLQLTKGGN